MNKIERRGKMKRVIITFVIFISNPCWALTYMGPPTSNIKGGQFGLGGEYSFSQMDIRLSGYGLIDTIDIEANTYFARLLFGIANNAELSVKLGIGDIEEDASDGFSSGNEFAWGVGAKAGFGGSETIRPGVLFQLISLSGDDSAIVGPYIIEGDFDAYEIQVATGITFDADDFCIYAGPFLHLIVGDLDASVGAVGMSLDIEQESEFGGYAGFAWNIADNTDLAFEYQLTGDADAIGISLVHRFSGPTKAKKQAAVQKPKIDPSGRKIKGYQGTTNPATGKMETRPIYENEKKE